MPKRRKTAPRKKRVAQDPATYYGFKSTHIIIGITGLLAVVVLLGSNGLVGGQSMVLGEKNEAEKQAQEQAKEAEKQQKETEKREEKAQKEAQKQAAEQARETKKSSPTIKNNSQKTETEYESSTGAKIKTKIEDGRAKIEMEQGRLKVKYEVKSDGRVELEAENEHGDEVELSNKFKQKLKDEVESELADDGVKIASNSGERVLVKNRIGAVSKFPLSIDVATNELIVTTPAGRKVVTVLPDQAIANMLRVGKVNVINTSPPPATESATLTPFETVAELEVRNDEVVYRIKGAKKQRFLGIIPVTTDVTSFVSAESGEPVGEEQSLIAAVVDLLSL